MRELAAVLNNDGIVISKELFDSTYIKYTGLFMKACYKLYDMGYLSSCSEFDEFDLKSAYFSDFPESVKLYEKYNSGDVMFEWKIADLALLTSDLGDSFKKVTKCVRDVLKYKDALDALDLAYCKLNMKKKQETLVYPRISMGTCIMNYSQIPLDNFALQECFKRNPDTHLLSIDTRDEIIRELCKHIGVSDKDYLSHKSTGESFFIGKISSKDELRFVDYIMSCSIELNGKFGKQLQDFITSYYRTHAEQQRERVSCVKFEEMIFLDSTNARIERVRKECRNVKVVGGREFYVTNECAVFEVPNIIREEKEYFFDKGFLVGNYVLDYVTGMELDKVNCLLGLSGEYISKDDAIAMGYSVVGKPILMHSLVKTNRGTLKDNAREYYPIYNVSKVKNLRKVNEVREYSLKPHVGTTLEFTFSDIDKVYKQFFVSSKEELFKSLRKSIIGEFDLLVGASQTVGRKSYSSLVADLVCALIFMDCGYPDYELCFESYEWVTYDIYLTACYDASIKFTQYYG